MLVSMEYQTNQSCQLLAFGYLPAALRKVAKSLCLFPSHRVLSKIVFFSLSESYYIPTLFHQLVRLTAT